MQCSGITFMETKPFYVDFFFLLFLFYFDLQVDIFEDINDIYCLHFRNFRWNYWFLVMTVLIIYFFSSVNMYVFCNLDRPYQRSSRPMYSIVHSFKRNELHHNIKRRKKYCYLFYFKVDISRTTSQKRIFCSSI